LNILSQVDKLNDYENFLLKPMVSLHVVFDPKGVFVGEKKKIKNKTPMIGLWGLPIVIYNIV
jgi:hypothetical protein